MFSCFQRRGLFKDKKLDKLWHKAQKSGLTEEELMILKSEFLHHQVSLSHIYPRRFLPSKIRINICL
jgi:hypothetical protein